MCRANLRSARSTRYFQYRDGESEHLVIRNDEEALYHLLSEGMEEFMELGQVLVST